MKKEVLIVGAGPSGLATAACLNMFSIPNIILEKEDCSASLWRKRAYDRLKLHLAKQFCELPHMPYPSTFPTFIPKDQFIQYLDNYQARFKPNIVYCTVVDSANYDKYKGTWSIMACDKVTGEVKEYTAKFLVVATGENDEGMIPDISGLKTFSGEVVHSSFYKSGAAYTGKNVLVVGSGNSGMEIAYDLSNFGAKTAITIQSPVTRFTLKHALH
ncbi:probable indole-3-pyruvate monooxygenase YUCCA10 [Phoenix dactylifera]|uniref:indole-3-pyruvate monooxygenase n=1 Tax=Phoenix dactylifera TaxID=42345 RepID=A0A8B9AK48_PHODC|nr:probable indole-3-pyruvate monooxygenase YUCCA10 [Phoenix dactylifera]